MNHLPSAPRCLTARTLARLGVGVVALTLAWAATARAQPAPPPAPAPAPVPAAPTPLPPGVKIGAAQIAVVGGNSAGARERALDEALRQAVDQALAEILDPRARTSQAKPIRALLQRARPYIKRYRTLEEGEVNGSYGIRVEAEIDEPALRRATERWSAAPTPPPATARAAAPSVLVVGSGIPEATAELVAALAGAGVPAHLGEPSIANDPARALQTAARAGAGAVAFVSATVTDEGTVRGPGKEAVSCRLNARLVAAPGGQLLNDQSAQPRVFADHPDAARSACVTRAAAEVAGHLIPTDSSATSAGADLKAITIDAAVSEPAALPALIKTLRALGSVSSAELRRLAAGRAEVRVQTRLVAPALLASLLREGASVLELSGAEAGADVIRLQARLRPNLPPAAASTPGPPPGAVQ